MSITFKQYMDSKDRLKRAVEDPPKSITEYTVCKYCTLGVVTEELDAHALSLKPSVKLVVEWCHSNLLDPQPTAVYINTGDEAVDTYTTQMSGAKLAKWLLRHTINPRPVV